MYYRAYKRFQAFILRNNNHAGTIIFPEVIFGFAFPTVLVFLAWPFVKAIFGISLVIYLPILWAGILILTGLYLYSQHRKDADKR